MRLFFLMVIGNIAPYKGIYFDSQDSIALNNKIVHVASDEKAYDYEFEIYKEDDIFHLNIVSNKAQSIELKFQRYSTRHGHSIHYKAFMSNEINFSLKEQEYHYQLPANQIERGTYECSISPGYEIEFFHVYHF